MNKDCFLLKENDSLSNNLLRLFSFFDIFDYPLTFWELKNYLNLEKEKNIFLYKNLNLLINDNKIRSVNGFYFLKGRDCIVEIRTKRYNYYQRKLKKAKYFSKLFSFFPSIKMIALVNSIGKFNLKDSGDIDFFIVTGKNKIWLSRLFCAGLAKLLNSRPNHKTKKDKICLSFYLSENNLNLKKYKYKNGDPYFDIWENDMELIFDRCGIFEKFKNINENNIGEDLSYKRNSFLENISKRIQLLIMPKKLKEAAKKKQGVVIEDNILKLYLTDKRLDIKNIYEQKIGKYI